MITYIKKGNLDAFLHLYSENQGFIFSVIFSVFFSVVAFNKLRGQSQLDDFLYIKWIFFPTAFTKAFGSFHLPEPLGNAMGIILTNEK
jgi:hypothetical protein